MSLSSCSCGRCLVPSSGSLSTTPSEIAVIVVQACSDAANAPIVDTTSCCVKDYLGLQQM